MWRTKDKRVQELEFALENAREEIRKLDKAILVVRGHLEVADTENDRLHRLLNEAQEALVRSIASTDTLQSVPKALSDLAGATVDGANSISHAIGALALATERAGRAKEREVELLRELNPRE